MTLAAVASILAVSLTPLAPQGEVLPNKVKISSTSGGFTGSLEAYDRFGSAIVSLGDLDGDGVGDIAIGAPGFGAAGGVFIHFLRPGGLVKSVQEIGNGVGGLTATIESGSFFGYSLANLGDLSGDGTLELVVGAPAFTVGRDPYAYILSLNSQGLVTSEVRLGEGEGGLTVSTQNSAFGHAAAALGDIDGDGVGDLAVGSSSQGVVVMRLFADGTVRTNWELGHLIGGVMGFPFVESLARLPDLDGDGIPELIGGQTFGPTERGGYWVLFLNRIGTVHAELHVEAAFDPILAPLVERHDELGVSIAHIGDVDGDGVPDIALGASGDDDGGTDRGAVYIVFLKPDGRPRAAQKIATGVGGLGTTALSDGDHFGASVAALGDRNNDGVVDLAVGAPLTDDPFNQMGAAWLLHLTGFADPPSVDIVPGTQINNACLSSATLPRIGTTWSMQVETSGHTGATFAYVFAHSRSLSPGQTTSFGELLLDTTSPFLFSAIQSSSGGTNTFNAPIPNDLALLGATGFAQAAILGGGAELCNALRIVVGN